MTEPQMQPDAPARPVNQPRSNHAVQRLPARGVPGAVVAALGDIKLAHTVFAMPFAVLAAVMALPADRSPTQITGLLALVVVCMVLARTWAMLVNRLADARFDALNPRTASRAVAAGRLTPRQGWVVALSSGVLFCVGAAAFIPVADNPWPAFLCVPVLGFIALYSYTKRFTWLCHVFLGAALAISPLAAAIAIEPAALADTPALYWIAGFVLLWVAGFDIIYALQDLDFDQQTGLHSVPAALGWRGAIGVSRAMHAAAIVTLVIAWRTEPRFHLAFLAGVVLVAGLLLTEHAILTRRGRAGIPMAFFTLNGIASVALGLAGLADIIV